MDFPAMRVALRVQINRAFHSLENGASPAEHLSEIFALIKFGETSGLLSQFLAGELKTKAAEYRPQKVERNDCGSAEDLSSDTFCALKAVNEQLEREREEALKKLGLHFQALCGAYQYAKAVLVRGLNNRDAVSNIEKIQQRILNMIREMFQTGLISEVEQIELTTKYNQLCENYI